MTEWSSPLRHGWRYGLHPLAVGMRVRTLGRVELPLGEALRLELASDAPDTSDMGHVQYYIATEAGAWAMWLSCPRADLPVREAILQQLAHPLTDES